MTAHLQLTNGSVKHESTHLEIKREREREKQREFCTIVCDVSQVFPLISFL